MKKVLLLSLLFVSVLSFGQNRSGTGGISINGTGEDKNNAEDNLTQDNNRLHLRSIYDLEENFSTGNWKVSNNGSVDALVVSGQGKVGVNTSLLNTNNGYNFNVTGGIWVEPLSNNNTYIGKQAGSMLEGSIGQFNTLIGEDSGMNVGSGSSNVVIGYTAGNLSDFGFSTVVGTAAGQNLIGLNSRNTLYGYHAGLKIATGQYNTIIGDQSNAELVSGSGNTYMGYLAGESNVTSNNQTIIGRLAGQNTTRAEVTLVGALAGSVANSGLATTSVGYNSLPNSTGVANTSLGHSAGTGVTNETNVTLLGFNAQADQSNQVVLGDNNVTELKSGNYKLRTGQTLTATEDNYVLTYDHGAGDISFEASSGGTGSANNGLQIVSGNTILGNTTPGGGGADRLTDTYNTLNNFDEVWETTGSSNSIVLDGLSGSTALKENVNTDHTLTIGGTNDPSEGLEKAIRVNSLVDDDLYFMTVQAGATNKQRQYIEFLDNTGSRTSLLGSNNVNSLIYFDAVNGFHPLIASGQGASVSPTRLSSPPGAFNDPVRINWDTNNQTSTGGLYVHDGSGLGTGLDNTYFSTDASNSNFTPPQTYFWHANNTDVLTINTASTGRSIVESNITLDLQSPSTVRTRINGGLDFAVGETETRVYENFRVDGTLRYSQLGVGTFADTDNTQVQTVDASGNVQEVPINRLIPDTGSASPVGSVTPSFVGQLYVDTVNGNAYISVGTTNADWIQL